MNNQLSRTLFLNYLTFQPFFINPMKLLPMSRFLPQPAAALGPKVKRLGGAGGSFRGRGSFGGRGGGRGRGGGGRGRGGSRGRGGGGFSRGRR